MNVEEKIFNSLEHLLLSYDKKKIGHAIDVGVGTFNFYFEKFDKYGYKTIAIEPLPNNEVIQKINKSKKTSLVEACLTDFSGFIDIYIGIFNGSELSDVSSIEKDWWGVTENSKVKNVKTITLNQLIKFNSISNISYFKIDTEGSEYQIIKQFRDIDIKYHPQIIEFEYGGGCSKKEKTNGWSDKYYKNTVECLRVLKELAYFYIIIFEQSNENPKFYNLAEIDNIDDLFFDDYIYGDILIFKEVKFTLDNAGNIILRSPNFYKLLNEKLFKIIRKIKKIIKKVIR